MPLATRAYSPAEQCADRWLHRAGILVAAVGVVVLLWLAAGRRDGLLILGVGLYGIGLLAMLVASAVANHDLSAPARGALWRERFDHAAIFLMIAGTYTPFTLTVLAGPWGYGLLAFVWTLALAGAGLKLAGRLGYGASIGLYLLIGWSILPALKPLVAGLPLPPLVLLVIGGVVYSAGVIVFLCSRLPFHTAIWHGMVMAAAGCHYAAVLLGVVIGGGGPADA